MFHPDAAWVCDSFETLLNQNVAWNVTFRRITELEALDNTYNLDFLLVDPKTIACLDFEQEIAPLATLGELKSAAGIDSRECATAFIERWRRWGREGEDGDMLAPHLCKR